MLEIRDLKVIFEQNTVNEKIALDGLNLKLEDGDFLTVIGSNGSGKTTLLNAILGLVEKQAGTIILDNEDITKKPSHKIAKDVGVVFQNPLRGTAPNMSIEENLALSSAKGKFGVFSNGTSKKNKQKFREVLSTLNLDLENRLETNVALLSGGQRQALTLLMATNEKPKLLLLDEHTAALDPKTAANILSLTDKIVKEKKITTIMITHNVKDAINYGNKLVLLNEGKIKLYFDKEEKEKLTVEKILSLYNYNLSDTQIFN